MTTQSDTDSNPEFSQYLNELIEERRGNNGHDSDISSVHASDLSDFNITDDSASAFADEEEWSNYVRNVKRPKFKWKPGPTFPLPYDTTPLDYFMQVMPDSMFDKMSEETNRYADQKNSAYDTCRDEGVPCDAPLHGGDQTADYIGLHMSNSTSRQCAK